MRMRYNILYSCIYFFAPSHISVPVMSLYNLMVIYLFLPIPRKDVALAAGLAVSAICLVMYAALSGAKVGLETGVSSGQGSDRSASPKIVTGFKILPMLFGTISN